MKKHMIRLMILSVLIIVCIGQTITLWLGDMSGHHFFAEKSTSYETSTLYPKEIWSNINGSIYKIEGANDEADMRYKLLSELVGQLRKAHFSIESTTKVSYANLLASTPGLIYEYGTALTLEEIIGQSIKTKGNKTPSIKIQDLYVDMSSSERSRLEVYLIDEIGNVRQKITLNKGLEHHEEAMNYYKNIEQIGEIKTYQASLLSPNDREIFKRNIFYPLNNQGVPLSYRKIRLKPLIQKEHREQLENYVNDLFKNPAYKIETPVANGVTFSDNLNVSVFYDEVGTLEFKKALVSEEEKSSKLENINLVSHFIKNSKAIPEFLKKGLYLKEVRTSGGGGETSYLFGYQYHNYEVVLSEPIKEKLGLETFLELAVKNGQITRGKWMMLEPVPQKGFGKDQTPQLGTFKKESNEAISDLLEKLDVKEGTFELEDLECAYIIEDLKEVLAFDWVGTYQKKAS